MSQCTSASITLEGLHYVIDHTPEPIGLHEQGVLIYANMPLVQLLGFGHLHEILGRNLLAFVPEELGMALVERLKTHVDPNVLPTPFETRVLRADGTLVDVETVSSRLEADARLVVMSSIRDISSRKRAEALLLKQAAVFEHAQRVASFGIWSESLSDGLGPTWSAETYRIYGLDPNKFTYRTERLVALIHPDDRARVLEARRRLVEEHVRFDEDYRVLRPDGKVRCVRGRGEIDPPADGTLTVTGVVQDITEHRLLEEQLARAQKMEAIGRLAGGIAHDFNNLLMVMMGQIDLAERSLSNPKAVQASLSELLTAVERASSLTKQLLATARRQVARPEQVDLTSVVSELETLVARIVGEDMVLTLDLSAGPLWVHADKSQLEQIILNLVVNARDAMPEGGRLSLRVREQRAESEGERSFAVLEVSDEGEGVPENIRERIFEPFFTTKGPGKGSGLGLSTVYAIAEQAGGKVELESEAQRGSVFRVFWPLQNHVAEEGRAQPQQPVLLEPAAGESLLLVEDDQQVRLVLALGLRALGYHVHTAENAEQGMQMLSGPAADARVLITDVVMPGMSGPALVRVARERKPQLRVLLLSGYAAEHLDPELLRDKHVRFLPKPASPTEISRILRELI